MMPMKKILYHRHRFHPDIIKQAIWLYFRFTMSYRNVEELLAEQEGWPAHGLAVRHNAATSRSKGRFSRAGYLRQYYERQHQTIGAHL